MILFELKFIICVVLNLDVYIIWYGNFSISSKALIKSFIVALGRSAWWAINKDYGVRSLTYKNASSDNYSQGKDLTVQSVWSIVANAINKRLLPVDTNGIYLVLSSRCEYIRFKI